MAATAKDIARQLGISQAAVSCGAGPASVRRPERAFWRRRGFWATPWRSTPARTERA